VLELKKWRMSFVE
jgi:hypothetical protein